MRRLPKDGRYPDFPSSNEDSEFTPSRTAVWIARVIVVMMAIVVALGLLAMIVLMLDGIRNLGAL
jgi:hypothetical protein